MAKWLVRGGLVGGVGAIALFTGVSVYDRRISPLFIGEPKSFEAEWDAMLGAPGTALMGPLGHAMVSHLFLEPLFSKAGWGTWAQNHTKSTFQRMIKQYPDCFVGYTGLAHCAQAQGDLEQAQAWLDQADQIAQAHPRWKSLEVVLGSGDRERFLHPQQVQGETTFRAIGPNIWTVSAPYRLREEQEPIMLQSSIIRVDDGSLYIINPTGFDDAAQEEINALGSVRGLITTTAAHGEALTQAHLLWPDADLYGTDVVWKHDASSLPWKGFFQPGMIVDAKNQPLTPLPPGFQSGGELEWFTLSGHRFKETLFYHKPTKSLVGLTDMMLVFRDSTMPLLPWPGRAYLFSTGLYRPDLPSCVGSQSYHWLLHTDQLELQSSVNRIRELDVEHITLGHASDQLVIEGRENCQELLDVGFRWVYNHQLSFFETLFGRLLHLRRFIFPYS